MSALEEYLSEDSNYYKQRAREFRLDFTKFIETEEYGVSFFSFDKAGVSISYDTSVVGHILDVSLHHSPDTDFAVSKDGNVRLWSKNVETFFDLGLDQVVMNELKDMILKQNTLAR